MSEDTKSGAADAGAEFVAYRNRNDGTIHLYDEANPDLDARGNFERVELSAVPAATIEEARRERANIASIANATTARQNRMRAGKDGDPEAHELGLGAVLADTPTTKRIGAGHPAGVLSRPGVDDVQIGPNPDQHPKTLAELRAQAALDAEVPQNVGVLVKQHLDPDDHTSDEVPAAATETAERLAPGTEVPEVKVVEPEPAEKPAPAKRAAKKAAPAAAAEPPAE